VVPYLRALGDFGTGKSRFLKAIGGIAYKSINCSGAITPAVIYRFIDLYGGTLLIDESDFRNSDEHAEIIKILNTGFMKGTFILRCEGQKDIKPRGFNCFCPKVIASREYFRDTSLESRCITFRMTCRTREDISLNLPDSFYDEAALLRNKLLLWRLRNHGQIPVDEGLSIQGIEDRINQIFLPLFSIIKSFSEEDLEEIQLWVFDYAQRLIRERGTSEEGEVLSCIEELVKENIFELRIKELALKCNELFRSNKDEITPRMVGAILKRLGLKTEKRGGVYRYVHNAKDFEELRKKYLSQ